MIKPTRHEAMDGGRAFLPDPRNGASTLTKDDLADELAQEFVAAATSAEHVVEDIRGQFMIEEIGGPFVPLTFPGTDRRLARI